MDKEFKEKILQWIFISLILLGMFLVIIGMSGCQRDKDVNKSQKLCQEECLQRNTSFEKYKVIETNITSYMLKCSCNTYASGDFK